MTAYTKTGDAGTVGHSAIKRVPYLVENTVDMSAFDPTNSPADTVQMLNIPAETCVMAAGLEVLTASSTSVTYDLGVTGVDADCWVDGHDATSTGHAQFDEIDATAGGTAREATLSPDCQFLESMNSLYDNLDILNQKFVNMTIDFNNTNA